MKTISIFELKKIAKIKKTIRDFFENLDFLEVETPILTTIPGMEPHLDPFETDLIFPKNLNPEEITNNLEQQENSENKKVLKIKTYLNTSPELQMKKLLSSKFNNGEGFSKIFNLTKVFRNKELFSRTHNPEFTMLEWYRKNANYQDLMEDCEDLIIKISQKIKTSNPQTLEYQNQKINLQKPWERISCQELFLKYLKIDLTKNKTFKKFKKTSEEKKYDIIGCQDWDDIFFKLFLNQVEPHLGKTKPTFVYDYPSSQAALAQKKKSNPFFAERFELYIAGLEIANAFSELIDSNEQRKRLEEEQNLRKKLKKTVFPIDEEFLDSLDSIKIPTAGIALGVDRLTMLILNKSDIKELLLFPMEEMLKI